ncbi:MAG: hypothetical protein ABI609_17695, partial [Acidobacteriota bacterium]
YVWAETPREWAVDARKVALETYLALIDTAQSHVVLVNGFPLLLEIQHAARARHAYSEGTELMIE